MWFVFLFPCILYITTSTGVLDTEISEYNHCFGLWQYLYQKYKHFLYKSNFHCKDFILSLKLVLQFIFPRSTLWFDIPDEGLKRLKPIVYIIFKKLYTELWLTTYSCISTATTIDQLTRRHTPADPNTQHHCCVTSNLALQCTCSLVTHLEFLAHVNVSWKYHWKQTSVELLTGSSSRFREWIFVTMLVWDVGVSDQEGTAIVLTGTGRVSDKAMAWGNAGARNFW
jgi:hypothetical protein